MNQLKVIENTPAQKFAASTDFITEYIDMKMT